MRAVLDWFSEPGYAAFAAFAVAVGSLVVAIVALVKSSRTQKRLLTIEERRERDRVAAQRRAELRVRLERRVRSFESPVEERAFIPSARYYVFLRNEGHAEAREVRVTFDGRKDIPNVCERPDSNTIRPGEEVRWCLTALRRQRALPSQIEVFWEDGLGEARSYRAPLTF